MESWAHIPICPLIKVDLDVATGVSLYSAFQGVRLAKAYLDPMSYNPSTISFVVEGSQSWLTKHYLHALCCLRDIDGFTATCIAM